MITAVVGLQWGDEGKGRAVAEILRDGARYVARANGGANAGHTIVRGEERFKFHQIPVGAFFGVDCVLGPGMVLDPVELAGEMRLWEKDSGEVLISDRAHVVLPKHKEADAQQEANRGTPLGTTLRGNGPAYADKALRVGIRMREFISSPPTGQEDVAAFLAPHVTDTVELLLDALDRGGRIVVEGAHGVGLDIDHGDYPFVSSSSCTTAGLLASLGLPPQGVDRVVGVFKPYSTRVGAGPIHEMPGELADWIREEGQEYGTTTGRPRRIGALDIRQVQRYAKLCGATDLFMTKGDLVARAFAAGFSLPVIDEAGEILSITPDDAGAFGEEIFRWVSRGLPGYISTSPETGRGVYIEPTY